MSKDLATICLDAPVDTNLSVYALKGMTSEAKTLMEELQFRNFWERFLPVLGGEPGAEVASDEPMSLFGTVSAEPAIKTEEILVETTEQKAALWQEIKDTTTPVPMTYSVVGEIPHMEVSKINVELAATGKDLNKIFSDLKLVKGSSTIADFSIPSSGFDVATKEVTFELYDDLIIEKDETTTIKVVARLLKLDGNFAEGNTIRAIYKGVVAEDQNGNGVTSGKLVGAASGEVQTLKLGNTTVEVTNVTASVPNNATKPGTVSFTFKVKAVEKNTVFSKTTGYTAKVTGTDPTIATGILEKVSGDATEAGGIFTIEEGKEATFALDYTLNPADSADSGVYRVTLETVAGVKVDRTSSAISLAF
ncbi:MAG: hypothetical protein EOM67_15375 [Spirochaetia bacterium]|nr:hypothetical protein [Spirochaetia bacterium]